MDLRVVSALAEPVGSLWRAVQAECIGRHDSFTVATPLSTTPLPIYQWVIDHASTFAAWQKVRFVLMDEQVVGTTGSFSYVPTNDLASYEGFANRHLLAPLRASTRVSIDVLKPSLADLSSFNVKIDLLILALGVGGNYANVMPGTPVHTGWHIAQLTPEFQHSHTGQSSTSYRGAPFRQYGMSLGPQQVLAARRVVVIVSGKHKETLANRLIAHREFDPSFPLSIIHHPRMRQNVTAYFTDDVGIPQLRAPRDGLNDGTEIT